MCIHICIYVCMYVYTYTYVCTHLCVYTHTYACTHTHTHTRIWLPWWLNGEELTVDAGDVGMIPGLRRSPGEGDDNPNPISLPVKSHGQKSLAGYSPWDCRVKHDQAFEQPHIYT